MPCLPHSEDRNSAVEVIASVVAQLDSVLPIGVEVVLHDFDLIPNSIVAIAGELTNREVGDPSHSMMLERVTDIGKDGFVSFESVMTDGRKVRSTSIEVRDLDGAAVAALSVNVDISPWEAMRDLVDSVLHGVSGGQKHVGEVSNAPAVSAELDGPSPNFVRNVDELAVLMIRREIAAAGVAVKRMSRADKLSVVQRLNDRGFFLIREAAVQIADALEVTRFTVYNYLKEIESNDA
ncbi:PAS domain-containing protein [Rhodococcus sp. IEGM 1241]|uniref:helix-turn-helix transcriptional regulator n=1 Tax=Rhodococcus TaxID=1827 RepID=UPI002953A3C1|nr:PAS domain-containing protein [Rhodococcus sp. IEGM 1241]MDV8015336.1 PAS domain-containing protein [Rhodococcus sp. IEGM 1241]